MQDISSFSSKHFVPRKLAEGVFSAVATDGGAAICNAGLIDLGGQMLIFDTFLTPQAAQDLRWYAVEQYDRTPQFVVNSHYHNDHIWGNQVFSADAQILSSVRTRDLIASAGKDEFRWYSANAARQLDSLREQYQKTEAEQGRQQLRIWMGYYEGLVEALPTLSVCLPGVTFDNRLEIHGENRRADLITFEDAHTGSDTVLYLPQDGIVFMADLLFVGCHPYLADGNPHRLIEALREIERFDANRFVPGHGQVGSKQDLALLIEYIEHCMETARRLMDSGGLNEDRIQEVKIPEQYQGWQQPQFYRSNLRFLCERLRAGR